MLLQKYESNEDLKNRKGIKGIVSIQGRLFVDCEVQSVTRGFLRTSREIGNASGNMRFFDIIFMKALENAIHKHMSRFGVSGGRVVEIYDYNIKYFNKDVSVKRVIKRDFKVIETKPHTRIIKTKKVINVKPYIRNGKKVSGYQREKITYKEILVRGYQRKVFTEDKGTYKAKITHKGNTLRLEKYETRTLKSLNKELININTSKNKAKFVNDL